MSDYPKHSGSMTVGALKKFLDNFPDDMYLSSHMGRAWSDQIRVQVSTVTDPENAENEPEEVLAIAGDSYAQTIWAD